MVWLLCHLHKEKGPWPPFMDHLLWWLGCFLRTGFALLQVIVGSFMYGGSKKNKAKAEADMEPEEANAGDEEVAPAMALAEHSSMAPPPAMSGGWASGMMRQMDSRTPNIDINSIRE